MLRYKLDPSLQLRPGNARSGNALVVLLVILLAGAGAAYLAFSDGGEEDSAATELITHKVTRERLIVSVTEDGNLESASNKEIKCQIEGGSTILFIVDDGTIVEEGQVIIELDKSGIEEQLRQQIGICEKADAARIKAEEDAAAAGIAVQEYVEGTYEKEKQGIEASIIIAKENLIAATNMLDHTQRMSRRGFATPLQVQADEFAVQRAKLDLKTAELAEDVLSRFTLKKMTTELEAAHKAALALARSEVSNVDLENGRRTRLEEQLDKCTIKAPRSGMVVYANERSRYRSTVSVEQGVTVQQNQTLVRIPQLSEMQAKVLVNESKIDQLKIGMEAKLKIQDREFIGTVKSIANQPEPTSFFSAQVKEYAVIVEIDGNVDDLKPGMTAEVEVTIADLPDEVTVPVSAVLNRGKKYYCWVETGEKPERRELLLGLTNDRVIAIKDGVSEGDVVILNPRAKGLTDELPADEETEEAPAGERPGREGGPGSSSGDRSGQSSSPRDSGSGSPGAGNRQASGNSGPSFPTFGERDKNKDGKITKDEVEGRMADNFDTTDSNKDGGIDASEYNAMIQRVQQMIKQRQGGSGAGSGAGGGTE